MSQEQKQFPEKLEGHLSANKLFLNGENRGEISAVGYFVNSPTYYLTKEKDEYSPHLWGLEGEDNDTDELGYEEAYFHMTDCNKSVRIELEFGSKRKYDNSIDKLENIIKIANAAQEHLRRARTVYLENLKKRKEYKEFVKSQEKVEDKDNKKDEDDDTFEDALRGL